MAIRSTLPPIDFIRMRRSVMAANITEPGPTPEELKIIIEAGLRVPDHSRCGPWRIQIIGKKGQFALGELYADLFAAENEEANEDICPPIPWFIVFALTTMAIAFHLIIDFIFLSIDLSPG